LPVAAGETLPVLSFQKWREPFSQFVRDTRFQPQTALESPTEDGPQQVEHDSRVIETEPGKTLSFEGIQSRWEEFLTFLDEKNQAILHSHLNFCDLKDFKENELHFVCQRELTFETLSEDAKALSKELSDFFQAGIVAIPIFDEAVVEANREKSPKELFEELAKTNELVKYLIDEFGAELMI